MDLKLNLELVIHQYSIEKIPSSNLILDKLPDNTEEDFHVQ